MKRLGMSHVGRRADGITQGRREEEEQARARTFISPPGRPPATWLDFGSEFQEAVGVHSPSSRIMESGC